MVCVRDCFMRSSGGSTCGRGQGRRGAGVRGRPGGASRGRRRGSRGAGEGPLAGRTRGPHVLVPLGEDPQGPGEAEERPRGAHRGAGREGKGGQAPRDGGHGVDDGEARVAAELLDLGPDRVEEGRVEGEVHQVPVEKGRSQEPPRLPREDELIDLGPGQEELAAQEHVQGEHGDVGHEEQVRYPPALVPELRPRPHAAAVGPAGEGGGAGGAGGGGAAAGRAGGGAGRGARSPRLTWTTASTRPAPHPTGPRPRRGRSARNSARRTGRRPPADAPAGPANPAGWPARAGRRSPPPRHSAASGTLPWGIAPAKDGRGDRGRFLAAAGRSGGPRGGRTGRLNRGGIDATPWRRPGPSGYVRPRGAHQIMRTPGVRRPGARTFGPSAPEPMFVFIPIDPGIKFGGDGSFRLPKSQWGKLDADASS